MSELLEAVPLTGMRAAIARTMMESIHGMAQLTLHRAVATGPLARFREQSGPEERPSYNDLVLAAAARALSRHPAVNATLEEETISRWRTVDLGMAVAVEAGLVVPVIRDAERLSLAELRAEAGRLAALAREGGLGFADLEGASFTVSNLGGLGIDSFTPIVNPPQVAILGVGRIREGAMTLSLTIDHRALDGAPGAEFLADLAGVLEDPAAHF